ARGQEGARTSQSLLTLPRPPVTSCGHGRVPSSSTRQRKRRSTMTIRTLSVAGLAFLVLGWASVAAAQSDCKTIVPASIWGPNDQTGATNRVTPAVVKAAAAEIRDGKVTALSYPLVDGVPLFGSRFTKTVLT